MVGQQEGKARETGKSKEEKGEKWNEMKKSGKSKSNCRRERAKRLREKVSERGGQARGSQKQTSKKPGHHMEKPSPQNSPRGAAAACGHRSP